MNVDFNLNSIRCIRGTTVDSVNRRLRPQNTHGCIYGNTCGENREDTLSEKTFGKEQKIARLKDIV